jgi:hypothetical protein
MQLVVRGTKLCPLTFAPHTHFSAVEAFKASLDGVEATSHIPDGKGRVSVC